MQPLPIRPPANAASRLQESRQRYLQDIGDTQIRYGLMAKRSEKPSGSTIV